MDKVFEKSRPQPAGSPKLKKIFLGNRQKRQTKQERSTPQYFPYGGGGDSNELDSQFNSYEPEELMVDSHVPIEEDTLQVWKRNARKILVRDSRYDVPSNLVPPNSRNSSFDPPLQMPVPEGSDTAQSVFKLPIANFEGLTAPSIPEGMSQGINLIRKIARASVVLQPLDTLADLWDDSWVPWLVSALELWLLMLATNILAKGVQLICRPAVWLLSFLYYFLK